MGYPAGEEYWRIKNRDPFWEVIAQGGTMRAACAAVGMRCDNFCGQLLPGKLESTI